MKSLLYAVPAMTLILGGCGGGSGLSGPDSNTQKGLGTLVVRVENDGRSSVNNGAAIVTLDKGVKVVRDSRAIFYNVTPGRHFVEARYQTIGLAGDSRSIEIEADKTLTITLNLSGKFSPAPTPTRSPFGD